VGSGSIVWRDAERVALMVASLCRFGIDPQTYRATPRGGAAHVAQCVALVRGDLASLHTPHT
jgi:hypothetical protein